MKRITRCAFLLSFAAASLLACDNSETGTTVPEQDTGTPPVDTGVDTGTPPGDTGTEDTGGDASVFDCTGKADGTVCGSGLICRSNACVASTCGDGFVDTTLGEECEDGNTTAGDGCNACKFECNADSDCNDDNGCTTDSCDKSAGKQLCKFVNAADATSCTPSGGGTGACKGGVCVKAGCGNGSVDSGEECDDGNTNNADGCTTSCKYSCHDDTECDDGNKCNGTETCNTTTHKCSAGTAITCAATGCATAGTCDPGTGTCTYADLDKDGVTCDKDCNDADPTVFPGAFECKDGKDNDCSTATADGTAPDCLCYVDNDGDGFAAAAASTITSSGSCPAGYTRRKPVDAATTDCWDGNKLVYPGETTPAPNYGYYASAYCPGKYNLLTKTCMVPVSWDYNCTSAVEKQSTRLAATTCVGATSILACVIRSGWVGTTVPDCGVSAVYRTCTWSGTSCTGTDSSRKQQCK